MQNAVAYSNIRMFHHIHDENSNVASESYGNFFLQV